jgi:hypothetical protein
MWQVVLGLRSLLVKIAIFVTMAALLAWALGGTLLPVVLVHQVREPRATYGIARIGAEGEIVERTPKVEEMTPAWRDAMTVVASPDGASAAFAFQVADRWTVGVIESPADLAGGGWLDVEVIDRLEAARQLARFAAGLPLQDEASQRAARETVLEAGA